MPEVEISAGYIKLYRKLLDNPIMKKPELLQLFIYCLLKANREPKRIVFNGMEMVVGTGQFITGRNSLAEELGQNPRTTYDRLKILEKLKILSIKSNNKFSLVTIVNYELYQVTETKSNSKTNNQPTTSQQLANTNKNDKNDKNIQEEDTRAREGKVFDFFNNNINPITPYQAQVISQYLDEGMEPELILEVLKDSLGKREKWSWVDRVLNNALREGVKTLLQYQTKKREREEAKIRDKSKGRGGRIAGDKQHNPGSNSQPIEGIGIEL